MRGSLSWKTVTGSALLLTTLVFGNAACTKKKANEANVTATSSGSVIKIGEVGSMTGSSATFGTSSHQALEIAVKDINAAGGIKGKQIELISIDDQGKPEEAATAITKLITQHGVVAVIGEVASSRSLAMAPIAQQYKIPMISHASTNPKVTEIGDHIFRVCFIDPFQGKVMARFALEHLKIKKAALLKDIKNDYSVGLAEVFAETFKAGGGEIVIEQSYSEGDIDFKSQLTAIRGKSPQAIFLPGYYTEVGLIARQARELGIKVPFMGGDGWDSPKLKEIGGAALDGSFISNHYSQEDQSPVVQNFIKKYRDAYGVTPDGIAAMAYDAMGVLHEALKRTTNITPKEIRDEVAKTKDYPGVTGKITMDASRNPIKSAVILKVVGGDFKFQTTIAP
jgi:branched-chain amino acid transport system substrate-binding protein